MALRFSKLFKFIFKIFVIFLFKQMILFRSKLFVNNLTRPSNCFLLRRLFSTTVYLPTEASKKIDQVKYKDCFNCVYQFRYINYLRLFSRIKIYQTGLSIFSAIGSVVANEAKLIGDLNSLLYLNGAMVFAVIMLFVISRQTVKMVGRLYLSDDGTRVLISHLNFFGKRRDIQIDLDDVEPLSSLEELGEKFLKLKLKDFDGHMIISLPLGIVYDKNGFLKVFKIDSKHRT